MSKPIENQIVEPDDELKKSFRDWGNYKKKDNCVYLYSNEFLTDKDFIELAKKHKVKIQLDLFS